MVGVQVMGYKALGFEWRFKWSAGVFSCILFFWLIKKMSAQCCVVISTVQSRGVQLPCRCAGTVLFKYP